MPNQNPCEWLRSAVARNRGNEPVGIYSVCSANPWVLEATMRQALADDSNISIESTSNQVNQFGGYTGMTPAAFVRFVHSQAERAGFRQDRILMGSDHLGPYPWRSEAAESAVAKACELVRASIEAGYCKIHLDASMACADDPKGKALADAVVAERAARMCEAAEKAHAALGDGRPAPVYVIGTEVPIPGGEQEPGTAPAVTRVEDAARTLGSFREAFQKRGLTAAWDRVIGLVVQPGVEFGDALVFEYERAKARSLSENMPKSPLLVYEAHSTDYQPPAALRELVEDHFAILKVGPWLTFAFREAIFALSAIEKEWLDSRRGVTFSRVRESLEAAMLRNPANWKPYYHGDEQEQSFARRYSYSDRSRYYWPDAGVQKELKQLIGNLSEWPAPLTLLSQYLPEEYDAVRAGRIGNAPAELVQERIRKVARIYTAACGGGSRSERN